MQRTVDFFGTVYEVNWLCLSGQNGALSLLLETDFIIGTAYMLIPIILLMISHFYGFRLSQLKWQWWPSLVLGSLFVFSCGLTHYMEVWTQLVKPDYALQIIIQYFCVLCSVAFVPTSLFAVIYDWRRYASG